MALEVKTVVQVLMQQHSRLFAFTWTIIGDTQMTEDVMQELSVLAVEKGVEVADETSLVVWLWRAARLKALEFRRQKRRSPITLNDQLAEQLELRWLGRPAVSDSQLTESLQGCMDELTPNNRQLLSLRYVEGKKSREIARALHRKPATVYQSIARLHRSLRKCIEARLSEATDD
jgi:RNA polymerase sigma-70 factor (ECF subfamily)